MKVMHRHDLVWLNKEGWAALERAAATVQTSSVKQRHSNVEHPNILCRTSNGFSQSGVDFAQPPLCWRDNDLPLIVCQQNADMDEGMVLLGLPLPPAQGKRRLSLTVQADHIKKIERPPLLLDTTGCAPTDWHATIEKLMRCTPAFRVFGSLAWQYLTGFQYLSATSDLDLCLDINGLEHEIPQLLNALNEVGKDAPMVIDCELISAAGGVQSRELNQKPVRQLLVKTLKGVRMMDYAEWIGSEDATRL